jgi:hypothetical protein
MFLKNGQACPDGTLGITCWNSLPDGNPIQDAINYIRDTSGLKTDGKIYVEYADYAGNVAIDGSAGNSYLIKGLFGLANTNGDFPTIGGSVSINNLYGGFTLSGFTITGGVSITDSAGNLVLQTWMSAIQPAAALKWGGKLHQVIISPIRAMSLCRT